MVQVPNPVAAPRPLLLRAVKMFVRRAYSKCKGCSGEFINKPALYSCRKVTGTHYKTPLGHTVNRSQPLAGIFQKPG